MSDAPLAPTQDKPPRLAPLQRVAAVYRRALLSLALVAGLMLVAVALLIPLELVIRETFIAQGWGADLLASVGIDGSNAWMLELTRYGLFAATFLGAPWVVSRAAHVRVDILVSALPAEFERWVGRLADLLCAVLCAVLTWISVKEVLRSAGRSILYRGDLVFPEWVLLSTIPICFVLCGLEYVLRLVVGPAGRERASL